MHSDRSTGCGQQLLCGKPQDSSKRATQNHTDTMHTTKNQFAGRSFVICQPPEDKLCTLATRPVHLGTTVTPLWQTTEFFQESTKHRHNANNDEAICRVVIRNLLASGRQVMHFGHPASSFRNNNFFVTNHWILSSEHRRWTQCKQQRFSSLQGGHSQSVSLRKKTLCTLVTRPVR